MRPPFKVIDSDGHINEPEEIIATYMPPPYDAYLHAWKANADGTVYSNNTLVPKQPGKDPTMGGTLGTNRAFRLPLSLRLARHYGRGRRREDIPLSHRLPPLLHAR